MPNNQGLSKHWCQDPEDKNLHHCLWEGCEKPLIKGRPYGNISKHVQRHLDIQRKIFCRYCDSHYDTEHNVERHEHSVHVPNLEAAALFACSGCKIAWYTQLRDLSRRHVDKGACPKPAIGQRESNLHGRNWDDENHRFIPNLEYPQPELGPELHPSPRPIQGDTGSERSFSAQPLPDAHDHRMHDKSSSENDDTEEESGVDEAENTEPALQQWQRQAAFLSECESYKEKCKIVHLYKSEIVQYYDALMQRNHEESQAILRSIIDSVNKSPHSYRLKHCLEKREFEDATYYEYIPFSGCFFRIDDEGKIREYAAVSFLLTTSRSPRYMRKIQLMRSLQPFWLKFWEKVEQKGVYAAQPILRAMVDMIDPSLYRDLDRIVHKGKVYIEFMPGSDMYFHREGDRIQDNPRNSKGRERWLFNWSLEDSQHQASISHRVAQMHGTTKADWERKMNRRF